MIVRGLFVQLPRHGVVLVYVLFQGFVDVFDSQFPGYLLQVAGGDKLVPLIHVFAVLAAAQAFGQLLVFNVCQVGKIAAGAGAHQGQPGIFLQWPLRQVTQ